MLPILYLRGLSTGDFGPALRDLLGEDASGLSPSSIARLTEAWQAEHEAFRKQELRFHQYAYWFVDGVNVSVRLGEDKRLCLLVVIGVREDGVKELLAVEDGYRESTESWAGVMRDLKARGVNEPKLVIGDGALGTWAALREVFPHARRQACWVHAIANVLDSSSQAAATAGEGPAARDHGGPHSCRGRPRHASGSVKSSTRSTPRRSGSSTVTGST